MNELGLGIALFAALIVIVAVYSSDLLALIENPANRIFRAIGLQQEPGTSENLNSPLQRMMGQQGILLSQNSAGKSRAKIGHSEWPVELGNDQEKIGIGEIVEVCGVENGVLQVKMIVAISTSIPDKVLYMFLSTKTRETKKGEIENINSIFKVSNL